MGKNEILDFQKYLDSYRIKIVSILKNSTYSELSNYLKLLPGNYETDDVLYYWTTNYINEYYQKVAALEKVKNNKNKNDILITEKRLYALYNVETYNYISLSFKEFIVFSRLVDESFGNEETAKIKPYNSNNENLGYIFNLPNVIKIHETEEIYYTMNRLKLDILYSVLYTKREEIIKKDIENCQFNDDNIDAIFSKKLAKSIKKMFK